MPNVAEAVPGCLHVSLFLFFAGLGDSLFNINTTVGISAIVPIGICTLLYIWTVVVPIIYPQSPYQNSFSGIIWYLFQKLRGRRFRDRGPNGGVKPVSAKMAQGQMQLAMEEKEERKGRDVRAIRWLIDNLTEDAEMEQFVMAIPGSLRTEWGVRVWKRVGERDKSDKRSQNEPAVGPLPNMTVSTGQAMSCVSRPSYSRRIDRISRPIVYLVKKLTPHHSPSDASTHTTVTRSDTATAYIQGEDVVRELSKRVTRTLEICRSRQFLANDDMENKLWRRRTRACIETVASLVFCANAEFDWFGDIEELLGDIGTSEKPRELSLAGTGQFFVMCWTCLSLVVVRNFLDRGITSYNVTVGAEILARQDDTGDDEAPTRAQKIDETLRKAILCLQRLYEALRQTEDLTEEVGEILRNYQSEISELEQINKEADSLEEIDVRIYNQLTNYVIRQTISQFPGVLDDLDDYNYTPIPFSRLVELLHDTRKMQFIRPGLTLQSMCSPAATLRKILKGQGDADEYKELLKNLKKFPFWSRWNRNQMQRELWRTQDLCDGGGLGFTVELFFLALDQLLSTSSSKESHSALYMGAFRTITSDWNKHKHSLGTQSLLLYIAWSRFEQFDHEYPAYIVDEFLELLGSSFEGQTRSRIDEVVQQLASVFDLQGIWIWDRVLEVIGARA